MLERQRAEEIVKREQDKTEILMIEVEIENWIEQVQTASEKQLAHIKAKLAYVNV